MRLYEVLNKYGLRTYHLDRELDDSEVEKVVDACETIVAPSVTKWMKQLEGEKAIADLRQKTIQEF